MRRAFSILFVLFFGLGPLVVLIDGGDNTSLPACCRRNGAHHCAMTDAMLAHMIQAALSTPAFTAPSHCPQYPARGNAAPSTTLAIARAPETAIVGIPALLSVAPSAAHARSIHLRTPALRGPPALTLAS
ncbi:MAG: hypothetical protein WCA10_23365 [Terracidiphilus sp.]